MKILIAVDMEGISGVVTWNQVIGGHEEYTRMRPVMTADVNAAVQGACEAGVDEIVVADGHNNGSNLLVEQLDRRARLVSGTGSPFSMVEGAQARPDAVFFVGYHARMGTRNAILDHTWSASTVANLWLNERLCGESGLNGAVCGHFGAPVLLVSGDQSVCAEASDWLPGVATVQVKRAVGRYAAECLPPEVAQEHIREAARQALLRFRAGNGPAALKLPTPLKVGVEFINSAMADLAALLPGSRRCDGRTIDFVAEDMVGAYEGFRAATMLAYRSI